MSDPVSETTAPQQAEPGEASSSDAEQSAPAAYDDEPPATAIAPLIQRPDAEGLMAVAALLLMVEMLGIPGIGTGGVGWHMALVVLGYAMTQSMVASQARLGFVDVLGLWTAGLRRIIPALAITVLAGLCVGALLPVFDRMETLAANAAAAMALAGHGLAPAAMGTGTATGAGPLDHVWMASVGAQALAIWTLVGALLLRFGGERWLYIGLFVLGAGAIGAAMGLEAMDAGQGRDQGAGLAPLWFWALAFGGLLVALDPLYWQHTLIAHIGREVFTVAGAIAIGAALIMGTDLTPRPSGADLLAVLGTGLILFARGAPTLGHVLINPGARWLGRSAIAAWLVFGLGLWLAGLVMGLPIRTPIAIALVAGSFIAGIALHRLFERPLILASWPRSVTWIGTLAIALTVALWAVSILSA